MLSRQRDGGWSWVVLGVVTLTQTILGGSCLTGGVLYVIFRNALGSSPVTLSWLCALPISMWFYGAPVGSFLTNRYGNRICAMVGAIMASCGATLGFFANGVGLLFFSHGVLTGLGLGINYTACMSATNQYFHKYKTLATGFTSIGHNAGLVIYSKLIIELDEVYSWKGTLLLLGGISFNMCAFAACLAPVEHNETSTENMKETSNDVYTRVKVVTDTRNGANPTVSQDEDSTELTTENSDLILLNKNRFSDKGFENKNINLEKEQYLIHTKGIKRKSLINWTLFRKGSFVFFCLSNILANLSQGVYILHLPSFTKLEGFQNEDITTLFTVYGVVNVVGKFVFIVLGQNTRVSINMVYAVCLAIAGVCMGLTPVLTSRSAILTLTAAVGFFYCVTGALLQAVIYSIVGYDRFPDGVGLSLPFKATGNLIGGPLAGFLLEMTGTYDVSFYLAGVSLVLAALCICPAIRKERHQKYRSQKVQLEYEVQAPTSD